MRPKVKPLSKTSVSYLFESVDLRDLHYMEVEIWSRAIPQADEVALADELAVDEGFSPGEPEAVSVDPSDWMVEDSPEWPGRRSRTWRVQMSDIAPAPS